MWLNIIILWSLDTKVGTNADHTAATWVSGCATHAFPSVAKAWLKLGNKTRNEPLSWSRLEFKVNMLIVQSAT